MCVVWLDQLERSGEKSKRIRWHVEPRIWPPTCSALGSINKPKTAHPATQALHTVPEEEAQAGPADEGVRGTGSHIVPLQLRLAAVALGTQHGATHQAQGGRTRLVPPGLGAPGRERDRKRERERERETERERERERENSVLEGRVW